MQKVISIIRSKGTFKNKETNQDVNYDNYVFYLTSGDRLYSNEEQIAGEGKPTIIKVKVEDYNRCCKDDPKLLFGKEVHFYTENGLLVQISAK